VDVTKTSREETINVTVSEKGGTERKKNIEQNMDTQQNIDPQQQKMEEETLQQIEDDYKAKLKKEEQYRIDKKIEEERMKFEEELRKLKEEKKRKKEEERLKREEEERIKQQEEQKEREEQQRKLKMEEEKLKKIAEEFEMKRKQEEEEAQRKKKEEEDAKKKRKEDKMRKFCGFLRKQGHVVKNWKTRFVVINEGQLYYFTSNTQTNCKGQFSMVGCTALAVDSVEGRENCFKIMTPSGKDFVLSAGTSKEKLKWLEAIDFVASECKAKRLAARSMGNMGMMAMSMDSPPQSM